MTETPKSQPTPPAPSQPRRRSPFFPALITLGCAALLTGGSLFGFISTCGNFPNTSPKQPINTIFLWAFLGAGALFSASAIWVVVLVVWSFFTTGKEDG
jgi:hypothetical protein